MRTNFVTSANRLVPHSLLALHNAASLEPWIGIHGNVYRLKNWIPRHPGGPTILLLHAGTDATKEFDRHHPDTRYLKLIESELVGQLEIATSETALVDDLTRIKNGAHLEFLSLKKPHFPVSMKAQAPFLEKKRGHLLDRVQTALRKSLSTFKARSESNIRCRTVLMTRFPEPGETCDVVVDFLRESESNL